MSATAKRQTTTFLYVADVTALAAQGTQTVNFRIDADADFMVQAVLCSAFFSNGVTVRSRSNIIGATATGTVTNGVGGTPTANFESVDVADMVKLYRDGQPNAGTVSGFGLHLIRLQLSDNNRNWSNSPVRADLLTSEPGRLLFFPREQRIAANANLTVTAYSDVPTLANDGSGNAGRGILGNAAGTIAPTVSMQVALLGYKLPRLPG